MSKSDTIRNLWNNGCSVKEIAISTNTDISTVERCLGIFNLGDTSWRKHNLH